jgi:hypothetical protein
MIPECRSYMMGIEVKASSTVRAGGFRGLRGLHRRLGKKMKAGIPLYDGEHVLLFGEGMVAGCSTTERKPIARAGPIAGILQKQK